MLRIELLAFTYFSFFTFNIFADNIPTLKTLNETKTKDVVISTSTDENVKTTLQKLKIDDDKAKKTEIKIQNNVKEKEDGSKITEQKILVNGKQAAVNVFEGISNKNKQQLTNNKDEKKVNFTKEVKGNDIYLTMDKKIEVSKDTTIKAEQLKLKEGDKNIYINFTPEIKVNGGNCGNCNNGSIKNKITSNNKSKKTTVSKNKKTTKITTKKTYAQANKKTKIQSMDNFIKKEEERGEYVAVKNNKKDNGSLYALDCVGGCQTDIYNSSITNRERRQKTIIKEVKKDEPIYVINRIIQVDDDTVLTDEKIQELVKGKAGIVAVQQIGGEQKPQARIGMYKTSEGLRSAYIGQIVNYRESEDIVDKTNEAYGEIAFVDADEYD